MTNLSGWTILVFNTFGWGEWNAGSVRIASESDVATTLSKMLVDQAVGVLGARVVGLARVDAVSVLAGAVQRAFGVRLASDGYTSGDRITLVSAHAPAVGDVTLRVALGIDATRVVQ